MFDVRTLDSSAILAIADDPSTFRKILVAADLLTMEDIGARIGISYYRVKTLRGKRVRLEADGLGDPLPRPDALPPSLPVPGALLWHPAEIETWGLQSGRLGLDGKPKRAQPTGRPKQRH